MKKKMKAQYSLRWEINEGTLMANLWLVGNVVHVKMMLLAKDGQAYRVGERSVDVSEIDEKSKKRRALLGLGALLLDMAKRMTNKKAQGWLRSAAKDVAKRLRS